MVCELRGNEIPYLNISRSVGQEGDRVDRVDRGGRGGGTAADNTWSICPARGIVNYHCSLPREDRLEGPYQGNIDC